MMLYILGGILICYALGYALGATKVILFQSTGDGHNAMVNICDVNGEYVDENGGCHNYEKVKINLKKATDIVGSRWANIGAALGFLVGFGVASSVEHKRLSSNKR